MDLLYIPCDEMKSAFSAILRKHDFSDKRADDCAEIFMTNSLEGVYSHGVYRFPRFVEYIRNGFVKPEAEPSIVSSSGSLEQWDGNLGPGPLNAISATNRAMELAYDNGIGLVAMKNTNHWMRGGTYGWHAARKGFVFIGWTNTEGNMPAWGATDPRLGNNPLVFAIPYLNGAIVLDFAMTQYSYGKLEVYKSGKKQLPYPGGFDDKGRLTTDPSEILKTMRALPIGLWKGSGLSFMLDILAASLSGGLPTCEISKRGVEYALSQIFIAIRLDQLSSFSGLEPTISGIISDLKDSTPADKEQNVRYPGESRKGIRDENLLKGIPVKKDLWEKILAM